ncbi:MAG: hypothetical protein HXM39_09070 [Lachnoanaerobaculum sp.]|nr:hypothetical protein [Lachnoanaerobaculum sp.]
MNIEKIKEQKKLYGDTYIGNVIRILSKTQLIINVGKNVVNIGDKLCVYLPESELKDLDGTSLGTYEHIKGTLIVIYVADNYAVCENSMTKTKKQSPLLALSPLVTNTIEVTAPLNVNDSSIEALKIKDKTIEVGDPVKFA